MKSTSARQMAINIALVITIVVFFILIFLFSVEKSDMVLPAVFALLLTFVISFFILNQMLHSFIFEKVNPIYKTIQRLNYSERELRRNLEEKDIIQEVKREVQDWAQNKAIEIRQLKEQARYRKEFLGNVSHELKTPIFNIQGYILTLLDGGLEDESINRKYLERTEKSINRMIGIVQDLESISKLEAGELQLKKETFNLVQMVREVYELQEMRAQKKNISMELAVEEEQIMVKADKQHIFQVLVNLIVNSINYSNEGGKTEVNFTDMGENVLVEVTDYGVGIKEEHLPRIFERFYRVDKSRSRDAGGTGLGLSIVKHIIEAHHQTINVRSSMGEGTTFAFTLKKA